METNKSVPFAKLVESLRTHGVLKHKKRQEFTARIIEGMLSQRSVQYHEIAQGIDLDIAVSSIERRVEDYMFKVEFDYEALLVVLVCFVPGKLQRWTLSMDRTEWDFGKLQVNILCVIVQVGRIGVPLYFEMLDSKSGNSGWQDRIKLFKRLIGKIGVDRLEAIVMDREFIGHRWLKWLKSKGIGFCVRVPKSHYLTLSNLEKRRAADLVSASRKTCRLKNVLVDGVVLNAWVERLSDGDLLYLVGTFTPQHLPRLYRRRWSIEVFFQALKKRGLRLESSCIRTHERMRKLFALVCLAYCCCWASAWANRSKNGPRRKKKHGYPQYSDFRFGLIQVRNYLKTKSNEFVEAVLRQLETNYHLHFKTVG